jgi:mRNA interferase MazF
MTSQPVPAAYGFTISSADLSAGRLSRPGQVRADKVYTLAQSIIVHRVGRVRDHVLDRIRDLVRDLLSVKP